jgi:uncharacterized membrane protein
MMWWGDWNEGMGAGWWSVMAFFWLAVVVFGVWGLSHLFPRGSEREDPSAVLKSRLAAGEITVQEYTSISAELTPSKTRTHL